MKKELFTRLDDIVKAEGILATNTSTLPVVELAVATERPSQVVGIHFFNPAPMMSLVEVVRPMTASDETVDAAKAFATGCGKDVVEVKDRAGFIVNALLFPYLNNAVRMLEAGTASRDDIDTAMKGGCNFPMGPLALLDLVGLDTSLSILDALYEEFRDPNYAAMPLLRRMVAAGQLGRKSGAGFFDYSKKARSVHQCGHDCTGSLRHQREAGRRHRRRLRHRHDDRLGLRRRRRERDHRVPQGGVAQGGGRRAVGARRLLLRGRRPVQGGRLPVARRGRGRAVGQPRHPREQRRRQLGRAAGRAGLEVVAPRARRERGGRVPRHQVPAAAAPEGRHRRGAGAGDQHRFGRRHPGARLRDLRLLGVEGGGAPAHPPPGQAPGADRSP